MLMQTLQTIVALTIVVSAAAQAGQNPAPARPPRVMFVCEHGAAKSLVATAYFNKIAAERGIPYRATFRGTSPQAELSVAASKGLREDGLEIPAGRPSAITGRT